MRIYMSRYFSVAVSQVKTDIQDPQNVLQLFLQAPGRVTHSCLPTCRVVVAPRDNFPACFPGASLAPTARRDLENFTEAKHQSPCLGGGLQMSSKFPVFGWRGWGVEFQAEMGKGHLLTKCQLPCQRGLPGCSAQILSLETPLLNGPICVCCSHCLRGLRIQIGGQVEGEVLFSLIVLPPFLCLCPHSVSPLLSFVFKQLI